MRNILKIITSMCYIVVFISLMYMWTTYVFLGDVPYGIFETQDRFLVFILGIFGVGSICSVLTSNNFDLGDKHRE